ncbi:MAG: 30S ribosomal protein S12 methylthiotransferase RimO [Deltaproteobacteria bacterium]|nr:MAG: 30S ribosomal protein S12 methylthiotransferase RimO [Deltaproteobacteria bacterium]
MRLLADARQMAMTARKGKNTPACPPATFYMVGLGCPKNRVDSDQLWAELAMRGIVPVGDPADAELIVINTCAFVGEAVGESLEVIEEHARYKTEGSCRTLAVCGCLPARFGKTSDRRRIAEEVDLWIGPEPASRVADRLIGTRAGREHRFSGDPPARVNSLSAGAAYLKVADGCSRRCSFCLIPRLRGPLRSRPAAELVQEAEQLAAMGVKELVLVAQDLASWGQDLPGRPGLWQLVDGLARVDGIRWIRMMYLFPKRPPLRLLGLFERHPNVLPYFDVPLQHADSRVLRRMRRGGGPAVYEGFIDAIRQRVPGAVIRTTFMVGFPGEDDRAFDNLLRFVRKARFERMGAFVFSPEPGTEAASMQKGVPPQVAKKRLDRLMKLQRTIAESYHRAIVGRRLEVLVEGRAGGGMSVGRAWNQAPEVDGETVIKGRAKVGEIIEARVTGFGPYHLEVEPVESPPRSRRRTAPEER